MARAAVFRLAADPTKLGIAMESMTESLSAHATSIASHCAVAVCASTPSTPEAAEALAALAAGHARIFSYGAAVSRICLALDAVPSAQQLVVNELRGVFWSPPGLVQAAARLAAFGLAEQLLANSNGPASPGPTALVGPAPSVATDLIAAGRSNALTPSVHAAADAAVAAFGSSGLAGLAAASCARRRGEAAGVLAPVAAALAARVAATTLEVNQQSLQDALGAALVSPSPGPIEGLDAALGLDEAVLGAGVLGARISQAAVAAASAAFDTALSFAPPEVLQGAPGPAAPAAGAPHARALALLPALLATRAAVALTPADATEVPALARAAQTAVLDAVFGMAVDRLPGLARLVATAAGAALAAGHVPVPDLRPAALARAAMAESDEDAALPLTAVPLDHPGDAGELAEPEPGLETAAGAARALPSAPPAVSAASGLDVLRLCLDAAVRDARTRAPAAAAYLHAVARRLVATCATSGEGAVVHAYERPLVARAAAAAAGGVWDRTAVVVEEAAAAAAGLARVPDSAEAAEAAELASAAAVCTAVTPDLSVTSVFLRARAWPPLAALLEPTETVPLDGLIRWAHADDVECSGGAAGEAVPAAVRRGEQLLAARHATLHPHAGVEFMDALARAEAELQLPGWPAPISVRLTGAQAVVVGMLSQAGGAGVTAAQLCAGAGVSATAGARLLLALALAPEPLIVRLSEPVAAPVRDDDLFALNMSLPFPVSGMIRAPASMITSFEPAAAATAAPPTAAAAAPAAKSRPYSNLNGRAILVRTVKQTPGIASEAAVGAVAAALADLGIDAPSRSIERDIDHLVDRYILDRDDDGALSLADE